MGFLSTGLDMSGIKTAATTEIEQLNTHIASTKKQTNHDKEALKSEHLHLKTLKKVKRVAVFNQYAPYIAIVVNATAISLALMLLEIAQGPQGTLNSDRMILLGIGAIVSVIPLSLAIKARVIERAAKIGLIYQHKSKLFDELAVFNKNNQTKSQ